MPPVGGRPGLIGSTGSLGWSDDRSLTVGLQAVDERCAGAWWGRIIVVMGSDIAGRWWFGVLGPLEASCGGRPARLGGERQRVLLALLLVHANELVTVEQLAEALFGEQRRESAANAVQVAVSRLRRALEVGSADNGVLQTLLSGYALKAGPEQLDAALFEQQLREGRQLRAADEPDAAATRLRDALGLWRGSPLADLAALDSLQSEIRRLEELRLVALMERIDADLALGRDAELVGELEALVAANPHQERLRGQLMLALYRSGRQTDALAAYRELSGMLRDELGLEPSRALKELERSILQQHPLLDAPPGAVWGRGGSGERLVCPFKGLAYFGRSDAEYFSGREAAVSDLVARAAESSLVGIVGPSGIGKSSLLCAGVLASLSAGVLPGSATWPQVLERPTEHPCAELTRLLGGEPLPRALAGLATGERMVIAVDQAEEVFTSCQDERERAAFLSQLADAAGDAEARARTGVDTRGLLRTLGLLLAVCRAVQPQPPAGRADESRGARAGDRAARRSRRPRGRTDPCAGARCRCRGSAGWPADALDGAAALVARARRAAIAHRELSAQRWREARRRAAGGGRLRPAV
jgi:DNA-binding SARP family transcriptional activator